MTLLGGSYVTWHIQIPYIFPLLKISFTPIKGEHGPLCILAYLAIPVTVVQPGFVIGGQSEGAKRPSGGRVTVGGGFPPSVGRFFFENLCMKTKFLAH